MAGMEGSVAERARRHPIRRLALAFISPTSYGMVMGLIVATYVSAVLLTTSRGSSIVVILQVVTVWFALRTSRSSRVIRRLADVVLAIALIIAAVDIAQGGDTTLRGLPVLSAILYFIAPISVLRHLIVRREIDQETILGALAAYLLIGMCFAFVYRSVGLYQAGDFFGSQGDGSMPQVLFFSFTTLTTTGYGNLVPAANPGQSLAVAEMLIGQLFLITAFGKVVNSWRPSRWPAAAAVTGAEAANAEDPDRGTS